MILDEIGRGTATFDGLSIAWATIEHLHEVNRCRGLFATHYHELTGLTARLAELSNHCMRVKEWQGDVVFLHEVGPGTADRSYGIHVARLAGLPEAALARAEEVLKALEQGEKADAVSSLADDLPLFAASPAKKKAGRCCTAAVPGRGRAPGRASGHAHAQGCARSGLSPEGAAAREGLGALPFEIRSSPPRKRGPMFLATYGFLLSRE